MPPTKLHIPLDTLEHWHEKSPCLPAFQPVCVGDPHETYVHVSEIERAYGLLWMVWGDDKKVHDARRILLDQIDREGQKRGIEFAKSQYATPDIMSVLHKLP